MVVVEKEEEEKYDGSSEHYKVSPTHTQNQPPYVLHNDYPYLYLP